MIIRKTDPFTKEEVETIEKEFGNYVKVTADLENGWMVVGTGGKNSR